MRKLAILILAIFVCTLTGGQTMYAQLFRPLEQSANENILENSGFWYGNNNWVDSNWGDISGQIDNTIKVNGISSFKSVNNVISMCQYIYPMPLCNSLTFSFLIKASNYANCTIDVATEMQNETLAFSEPVGVRIANPTQLNEFVKVSGTIDLHAMSLDSEPRHWINNVYINITNNTDTWICQPKLETGKCATLYRPSLTDNVAWDYDTPNNSFQSAKIGNIKNIISYSYHKSLTCVGDFSMTFSKKEQYANLVVEDTFIYIEGDWLIVNNVKLDNDIYTVTGFDGKGLLMQRITLYDVEQATGAMGYDICQGSTEAVAKHYVANNIVNPLDDNRKIVGVALGDNQDRGIQNDSYMSRLEPLHEVIEKLCKFANIGYDIKVDLMNNKQIFDIVDITDKSASQRDRPQIIFEKNRHNVLSLSREFGNSNEKNCYYATKSGGNLEADAITILVTPTDTVAKGIKRREMHLNVSCDSVADIALYAKQQMTPYQKTNSFAIATSDVANYGKLFFIGDKVTIRDTELNITEDLIINGVKVDEANGSKNVVLEFGESKPKLIRDFNNKINNKGV